MAIATTHPHTGRPGRDLVEHAVELRLTVLDYYEELRDSSPDERPSRRELHDQIRVTEALRDSINALQSLLIAGYAATGLADAPDEATGRREEIRYPIGHKDAFADTHLAPALGWTPAAASARVDAAIDAATLTAPLLDAQAAGRVGTRQVAIVAETLRYAPDDIAAQIVDAVLQDSIGTWTPTQTRRRTGALMRKADPIAAERQRAGRRRDLIDVTVKPGPVPGLTDLRAVIPTEQATAFFRAIDNHARVLHTESPDKAIGQCRVDALLDLVLDRAEVSTRVDLRIPLRAMTDPQTRRTNLAQALGITPDTPAQRAVDIAARVLAELEPVDEADRWFLTQLDPPDDLCPSAPLDPWSRPPDEPRPDGLPTDETTDELDHIDWDDCLAHLLDELDGRLPARAPDALRSTKQPPLPWDTLVPGIGVVPAHAVRDLLTLVGTTFTATLLDLRTGATSQTCTTTYRPTAAIRNFVVNRDQHCRFPGCTTRAALCDVDHVVPWPAGPTAGANLHLLCRHHHRAKHESGWTVTMTTDGIDTWTSPTGERYVTRPADSAPTG